jgi:hypothetical protein
MPESSDQEFSTDGDDVDDDDMDNDMPTDAEASKYSAYMSGGWGRISTMT